MQKATHIFSQNISEYAIYNDQSFNDTLTNDIVSFEQLGPDIFHISAQNIDCGYSLESLHGGGSNDYPQSMFLSRNKNNNVYPCKPLFTI